MANLKRITHIASMSMAMLVFSACQKTNDVLPSNPNTSSNNGQSVTPMVSQGTLAWDETTGHCVPNGNVCTDLGETTINGNDGGVDSTDTTSVKQSLLDAQGSPNEVGEIFRSPAFSDICKRLGVGLASKLKSGNYDILVTSVSENAVTFIANQNSVSVENFEFAVQLDAPQN